MRAHRFGQMVLSITGIGRMIRCRGRVNLCIRIKMFTKVSSSVTEPMDVASTPRLMERCMMDSG